MRATIWARGFTLPAGFCYNCNTPTTASISVRSEGGIASSVGAMHGPLVAALSAAATFGFHHQVPYCARCAVTAHKKPPDRVAGTLGLLLLVVGFGAIATFTTGVDRIVSLTVAVAALGGLIAWLRYVRRPLEPGQTTRWRAFAVLNEGKDLLRLNREFMRIEYSNPLVLDEIRRLNPGIEVTAE
jgi:hypothetical protein